jgi:NCS2 family nucleobase:cation symporter-2
MTVFPLGFYPSAFIPILIGFVVTSVETIGDITASMDASQIPSTGKDAETRVQGGLLCDGINSLVATLMTTPPNTTFSQNNGVIALTRCASRAAGLACAGWLLFFGMFGKFAGIISSIPEAVLGGMTIFLFANVLVSGIAIIAGIGLLDRRNRFILALALGVGVGVTAVPDWAEGGGVATFYGGNLRHNIGLMPARDACAVFPTKTVVTSQSKCTWDSRDDGKERVLRGVSKGLCKDIGARFEDEETEVVTDFDCVDNNGLCCLAYDPNRKMWRDTVVIILKTPYCIGTLIALFLNTILPHEEADEADKDKRLKKVDGDKA